MTLRAKSGSTVELPSKAEDSFINTGIVADEDTMELGDAWFAQAKPASQVLSQEVFAALVAKRSQVPYSTRNGPPLTR